MKVFCPNCGSENDGFAGGRVVCRACTATFDVPAERASVAPVVEAPVVMPAQSPFSAPVQSQPMAMQASANASYNQLAIASIISSFCCSPAGLITGIIGLQQINKSNGLQKGKELAIIGIVISSLGMCSGVLYVIAAAVGAGN